jgi:signal peptidase I
VVVRRFAITVAAVSFRASVAVARRNLRRYEIAERSMEPALLPGDWVIAVRTRHPSRGDVVVVPHPHRAGFELVKRVVGLAGETIAAEAGVVTVDGAAADVWAQGPTLPDGTWQIPHDSVFVLGDARLPSQDDSRTLGPVPLQTISWRVRFRYWPWGRIGLVYRSPS